MSQQWLRPPGEVLREVRLQDAASLSEGKPPQATCPRCQGPGSFDDDAQTYFSFIPQHAAGAIPGVDLVLFGVLLILAVAFAPRGLIGLLRGLGLRR